MREGAEWQRRGLAFRLGSLLQALILGIFLFAAVARLVAIQTDARVFQYQAW
jgi:hypothetical protein